MINSHLQQVQESFKIQALEEVVNLLKQIVQASILSKSKTFWFHNNSVQDLPVLERYSQRYERFTVDYQDLRIGNIRRADIETWVATAPLEYGAAENKLETRNLAANWLVENYLKIRESAIKFDISKNLSHCTIEYDYILIKIDETPEDYLATIQDGSILNFEYFPDLRSAVAFSFDLILNPTETSFNYDTEF